MNEPKRCAWCGGLTCPCCLANRGALWLLLRRKTLGDHIRLMQELTAAATLAEESAVLARFFELGDRPPDIAPPAEPSDEEIMRVMRDLQVIPPAEPWGPRS